MGDGFLGTLGDPHVAILVTVTLVAVAASGRSRLLKVVLYGGAVATLVWALSSNAAQGTSPQRLLSEITWAQMVTLLEKPLVALILAVALAFVGTHAGWRLVKLLAFCAAFAAVIWAAISYAVVGEAVSTGFQVLGTVLIVLIIGLTVVVVVTVLAVLVMSLAAAAPRHRPYLRPDEWLDDDGPEYDRAERFMKVQGRLMELLDEDTQDSIGSLVRFYFSGLHDLREDLAELHRRCDEEIEDLARVAPAEFPWLKAGELRKIARRRTFLPGRDDLADVFELTHASAAYLAMRLLVLRKDWRQVATIFYKSHFCITLLAARRF